MAMDARNGKLGIIQGRERFDRGDFTVGTDAKAALELLAKLLFKEFSAVVDEAD